ncbi:hypothetical protein [Helicobacter pylori]|uniref:hypothetical protein n=1 Tax=Helicobacter pylori TaxID=210 RepID=UPI0013CE1852|nr:hypothetical protein [Helicobacter pylori]
MTKQSDQKPVFKNKSFSNRAKNSVIKKFKNSNAFLKKSPKTGTKAVLMAVLWLGVLTNP